MKAFLVARSFRWIFLAWTMTSAAAPAWSFTFSRINNGTDQILNWRWEYNSTSQYYTCQNDLAGCGNVLSSNGRIPLQGYGLTGGPPVRAGGMLDWTASSGALKVVAMPIGSSRPYDNYLNSYAWGAVDARTFPLEFTVIGEVGDPFPLNIPLLIRPRLLLTVDQASYTGSQTAVLIMMDMTVKVNGVIVCQDTLNREYLRNDQLESYPVTFPKGGGNSVIVPNATNGTLISVAVWAYIRSNGTRISDVFSYSPYGIGPAIEVDVRSANAVGVDDEILSSPLSLATAPNPSRGSVRIGYQLPRAADVRVAIYDVSGHRVATVMDRRVAAGGGEVAWNGRAHDGRRAPAGVYLVELRAGVERRTQRLVLLGER